MSVCAGGMFARPGGALFSGLNAVTMYGGLVLFGAFLLYDTQKVIKRAEMAEHYDPINGWVYTYIHTQALVLTKIYSTLKCCIQLSFA